MRTDSIDILEKYNMAQLIDLVMTDRLNAKTLLNIRNVSIRCRDCRNTRSRETYLTCRAELEYNIRISCFLTFVQNI